MINNNYSNYNLYKEKQKRNAGFIPVNNHSFSIISTFGVLASGFGVFDYLDTYKSKNIKQTTVENIKEKRCKSFIGLTVNDWLELKQKAPVKYYGYFALGALILSTLHYGNKTYQIWIKDEENKEKKLQKNLNLNTLVNAAACGFCNSLILYSCLNNIDEIAKKKGYKTKNALKGLACGALVAGVVGGLTLLTNKFTLDKFKKEQKQEV